MYILSSGLYPEKQHCGCEVQVEQCCKEYGSAARIEVMRGL
nr:MAG TPA: hypothetical protein [Caudoviricetes sp.]